MAVARNGLVVVLNTNTTGNASTSGVHESVTIPASTTLMLMWVTGYPQATVSTNYYSSAPPEIGGSNGVMGDGGAAMSVAEPADDTTANLMGACFYLINPPIGASKNIAWDWPSTGVADTGLVIICAFYTGTHATTPIGANGHAQGNQPLNSGALANSVGDIVVGFSGLFSSGAPTSGWTNLTQIQDATIEKANTFATYAETNGTGSPITPTATWSGGDDGAMVGIVIQQAAGGIVSGDASAAGTSTVTGIAPEVVSDTANLFYRRRR